MQWIQTATLFAFAVVIQFVCNNVTMFTSRTEAAMGVDRAGKYTDHATGLTWLSAGFNGDGIVSVCVV
jgi:hypothetical protein